MTPPAPECDSVASASSSAVHRSESSSDISVLSNPSQSSIEVLPRRPSPGKEEEYESEERAVDNTMTTTTDTLKAEEANAATAQNSTKKMIESSSSGKTIVFSVRCYLGIVHIITGSFT